MEAGPKKAELWNFSVKIQNKRTGMSVETTCSVAPLDWKIEDIQTSGNYLKDEHQTQPSTNPPQTFRALPDWGVGLKMYESKKANATLSLNG